MSLARTLHRQTHDLVGDELGDDHEVRVSDEQLVGVLEVSSESSEEQPGPQLALELNLRHLARGGI
jgi:hypothetical protein